MFAEYMRFKLWLLFATAVACGGCVSCPPARHSVEVHSKELEISLLQEEIGIAVGNVYALQRQLVRVEVYPSIPGALPYSGKTRDRDLDRVIEILRETRGRLVAEEKRISRKHRVPKPEY